MPPLRTGHFLPRTPPVPHAAKLLLPPPAGLYACGHVLLLRACVISTPAHALPERGMHTAEPLLLAR